jgi:hypothetical protein
MAKSKDKKATGRPSKEGRATVPAPIGQNPGLGEAVALVEEGTSNGWLDLAQVSDPVIKELFPDFPLEEWKADNRPLDFLLGRLDPDKDPRPLFESIFRDGIARRPPDESDKFKDWDGGFEGYEVIRERLYVPGSRDWFLRVVEYMRQSENPLVRKLSSFWPGEMVDSWLHFGADEKIPLSGERTLNIAITIKHGDLSEQEAHVRLWGAEKDEWPDFLELWTLGPKQWERRSGAENLFREALNWFKGEVLLKPEAIVRRIETATSPRVFKDGFNLAELFPAVADWYFDTDPARPNKPLDGARLLEKYPGFFRWADTKSAATGDGPTEATQEEKSNPTEEDTKGRTNRDLDRIDFIAFLVEAHDRGKNRLRSGANALDKWLKTLDKDHQEKERIRYALDADAPKYYRAVFGGGARSLPEVKEWLRENSGF